jgi:dipeptidyl-peptidase-4
MHTAARPLLVRAAGVAALLWAAAAPAFGQRQALTLATIYDPANRVNFSGSPAPTIAWIDATHYAQAVDGDTGVTWKKIEAPTGAETSLFDAAKMAAALGALPGVTSAEAHSAAVSHTLVFDRTYSAVVVGLSDNLYVYRFGDSRAIKLTSAAGPTEQASFSPDGRLVAFVRAHNLYVADANAGGEKALTTDGGPRILNGVLDWVYEEEIYGRGEKRAYWWSPDSKQIAFLHLDDRPVPTFTVVDYIPYDPDVERWDYPKAGEPNPIARLGVSSVAGGPPVWMDTSMYPDADRLIVRVSWMPDSRQVIYAVQNRIQSWLALDVADARSSFAHTLMKETSKFWIGADEVTPPLWLHDGSFLWLSDRSGFRHVYHYRADGTLIGQITRGGWEVRSLFGVDEAQGWIYFSSTERSPIGRDIYRVRIDGTKLLRLSAAEGSHSAEFSPTFLYFTDTWSDVLTPPQTRLHKSDGTDLRVIAANKVPALHGYLISKPEFLQVRTRDGFVMEAMMIKPPHFDPSRRYPVYQFAYGGPHIQTVMNQWGGSQFMFHQLLAQQGVIVWMCDNRTASGKGSQSEWPLFRNFGELELKDIEDGVAWLKQQPWVDGRRIGIHGWSYGGYLTSYALTHSQSFVMGIAGGTVADWRDYDSIYTERYMGLPDQNPDGYRRSSPRFAAADLHGALLLIHGTIDDNVHLSNTLQFAYELQKAQKPFQLMLYPKSRHGIIDPALVWHFRQMMLDFVLEHLQPDRGERQGSRAPNANREERTEVSSLVDLSADAGRRRRGLFLQ